MQSWHYSYLTVKPKNKLYEDLLANLRPTISPPDGLDLSIERLNKISTQTKLLESLTPYMNTQQEEEFKKRILEQMLGDGTGDMFKQEYPGSPFEEEPKARSLDEFLETLK